MKNATATIEILSTTRGVLEVNYPDGTFSMHRIEVPSPSIGVIRPETVYDHGYSVASRQSAARGVRLDRYSRT